MHNLRSVHNLRHKLPRRCILFVVVIIIAIVIAAIVTTCSFIIIIIVIDDVVVAVVVAAGDATAVVAFRAAVETVEQPKKYKRNKFAPKKEKFPNKE